MGKIDGKGGKGSKKPLWEEKLLLGAVAVGVLIIIGAFIVHLFFPVLMFLMYLEHGGDIVEYVGDIKLNFDVVAITIGVIALFLYLKLEVGLYQLGGEENEKLFGRKKDKKDKWF